MGRKLCGGEWAIEGECTASPCNMSGQWRSNQTEAKATVDYLVVCTMLSSIYIFLKWKKYRQIKAWGLA
jgi:hypothetical protein